MEIILNYIQGILETLGLLLVALTLCRVKIRFRSTIIAAVFITAAVLAIRNAPLIFGIHVVFSIVMIFIFIITMTDVAKSNAFVSVFAGFLFLALIEYILNQLFINLSLLSIEDATGNSNVWMIMGYIQAGLLNLMAIILQRVLEPVNRWKSEVI